MALQAATQQLFCGGQVAGNTQGFGFDEQFHKGVGWNRCLSHAVRSDLTIEQIKSRLATVQRAIHILGGFPVFGCVDVLHQVARKYDGAGVGAI